MITNPVVRFLVFWGVNALMLLLVAWLVPGFMVAGFWSGFLVAIFVSVFSFIVNSLIGYNKVRIQRIE